MRKSSISIIGAGIVGTATGKGLAELGYTVIFHDVNEKRLEELLTEGYEIAKNISHAVLSTSTSLICVQTPTIKGVPDLKFVKNAIISVAKVLDKKKGYHLVVVRSTLQPGTTREILLPLLRKYCGSEFPKDYGVCYNPEFLRQTSALKDFLNPSRIVIGAEDDNSREALKELYSPIDAPKITTNFDNAEMIKCVSNAFLATKISFFNEMYLLCEKLGINDKVVSEAVSLDPRISKYGIYGGRPFSGGCLPKDVRAFATFIRRLNINPEILDVVLQINLKLMNARVRNACEHNNR